MDDIKNVPVWGLPEDFNDMLNNRSGNQRTSYDEIRDPYRMLSHGDAALMDGTAYLFD
jgi:hypothetical protein